MISAPIEQKFDVVRKVRSLAFYAVDGPFFCILPHCFLSIEYQFIQLPILLENHATHTQM